MLRITAALILFMTCVTSANNDFILTGEIKASENQVFYSPKTDNWRVQLQWMLPEGDVANKGDLVVVFDSGSIQSKIEQEEVSLLAAEEELFRLKSEAEQKLLEASFQQKRTVLLLEKSRIDAGISEQHLSQFDYNKNQLAYEKAVVVKAKADENLKQTKISNSVSITKQTLKIEKHKEKLQYNKNKLLKMSLYAERSGPVLYGNHPWNGEKVFVGMTAQPSWEIAKIPSINGLYVEAWVHEVDMKYLAKENRAKLILDAYPESVLMTKLMKVSTQPEERKEWGTDVYYRSTFEFESPPELILIPGMSAQLEFVGGNND